MPATGALTTDTAADLGRVMGQLHVAAESFPDVIARDRPAWWEAEYFRLDVLADVATPDVTADLRRYIDEVRGHATREVLVHGDLGPGNVIIGSELHVIDFDDACRAEPEYDMAVTLVRLFADGGLSVSDIGRLVPSLVAGYRSACPHLLDPMQVERYARVLLLQAAVAACRRPGCPGLTAAEALARAWSAISGPREMPRVLALAVERVTLDLSGTR
jgi:Ser/Thr protein kinase RdoA (MazF antagonist)